jgi:hypothetical protein
LRENPAKVSNEKSAIKFVRGMFFSLFHKKNPLHSQELMMQGNIATLTLVG